MLVITRLGKLWGHFEAWASFVPGGAADGCLADKDGLDLLNFVGWLMLNIWIYGILLINIAEISNNGHMV